jgi:hypothetical protein
MIAFYIVGLSMKTPRNALFMDSTNSIIEKMAMIMRTVIETEEKAGLKRCFGTFLSIEKCPIYGQGKMRNLGAL